MSTKERKGKRKEKKDKDKRSQNKEESRKDDARDDVRRIDFTILIDSATHLPSRKEGAKPNSFCRYSFYGEEKATETSVVSNSENPVFRFVETHAGVVVNEDLINSLVNEPLVISVMEADKKHSITLGTAVLNWTLLLQGDTSIEGSLPLYLSEGVDESQENSEMPELHVAVTLSEPILSKEEWEKSNILTVTLKGIHSLPPRWIWNKDEAIEENPYAYHAYTELPGPEGSTVALAFEEGYLSLPLEEHSEGNTPLKRKRLGVLLPEEVEEERRQEQFAMEERNGQRVNWPQPASAFLGADMVEALRLLCEGDGLYFDFRRSMASRYEATTDPNAQKYRACFSASLSELLEPGRTSVTCRCFLKPVAQARADEESDDSASRISKEKKGKGKGKGKGKRGSAKDPTPRDDKARKESKKKKEDKKSKKKGSGRDKVTVEVESDDEDPWQSGGGGPTYVLLTVETETPLVPIPVSPKPVHSISDYISPNDGSQALGKYHKLAQSAQEEFKYHVEQVVHTLLDEYKMLFATELLDNSASVTMEARQQRRKKLIYELNSSGQYFNFKEKLKMSLVRVVREKFERTTPFATASELHAFLNDVFVHAVASMHEAINNNFASVHAIPIPTIALDAESLKNFATVAEINLNLEQAADYYGKRIMRKNARQATGEWYDYAAFCLRNLYDKERREIRAEFYDTARGCLREAIAIDDPSDPYYVRALLAHGVLCAEEEDFIQAETFLKGATELAEEDPVAWNILALLYGVMEDDEAEASALARARSLAEEEKKVLLSVKQAAAAAQEAHRMGVLPADDAVSANINVPALPAARLREMGQTIHVRTARFLLDLHLTGFAERAIARELHETAEERSAAAALCLGEKFMQSQEDELAEKLLQEVTVSSYPPDLSAEEEHAFRLLKSHAWVLLGHIHFLRVEFRECVSAYEAALKVAQEDVEMVDLPAVYLRLGAIYLTHFEYEEAKAAYLKACRLCPSDFTWLGAGVACYRLEQYDEAEDALSEGNILNPNESDIWGYLTLICLAKNKLVEADQSLTQAMKLGIENADVLREIGERYAKVQRFIDAEECLLISLRVRDLPAARRALGDVFRLLKRFDEAEAEYNIVISRKDGFNWDDGPHNVDDRLFALKGLEEIALASGDDDKVQMYRNTYDNISAERAEYEEEGLLPKMDDVERM